MYTDLKVLEIMKYPNYSSYQLTFHFHFPKDDKAYIPVKNITQISQDLPLFQKFLLTLSNLQKFYLGMNTGENS